jgi:ligand-binding sensor domain-containing protein/signal transduction histidine kinase
MIVLSEVLISAAQTPLPADIERITRVLPSPQLTSIMQDKYGFLWLGTEQGLVRWDGAKMHIFTQRTGDTTSLPANAVTHLHEDKRGRLWVATTRGLVQFHRHNETFSRILTDKAVADVHEDRTGALWCWLHTATVQADEICIVNPDNGAITSFKEGEKGLRSAYLYAFLEDKQGTIWLGTTNGLHRYNRDNSTFTAFLTEGAATSKSAAISPSAHILSLAEDNENTLLVGTMRGLMRTTNRQTLAVEPFTGASSTPLLRETSIIHLQKLPSGNIIAATLQRGASKDAANKVVWIDIRRGTMSAALPAIPLEGKTQSHRTALDERGNFFWGLGNGAISLNTASMQASLLCTDPTLQTRINTPVVGVIAGASGQILFAHANVGVSAIPPPTKPFRGLMFSQNTSAETLLSRNISALGESSDGNLWIGYMGGLGVSHLNRSANSTNLTHFRQDARNPSSLAGFNGETNIYTFYGDKRGTWWIGGYALERFTGAGFEHTPLLANTLTPTTAILEDTQGRFWVGSTFGLFLLEASAQSSSKSVFSVQKHFVNQPSNEATLGNNNIHAILEDRTKTLWIGHDGGVDRFDPATKRFTHLSTDKNGNTAGVQGAVTALLLDSKGNVWIGTREGLVCYDPAKEVFQHRLSTREGLPSEAVCALQEDAKGNIWISTKKGLCRYSTQTSVLTRFSRADGLQEEEFSEGAGARTKDGMLWFGGRSGVVYFHPDSIQERSTPNNAVIVGLKKFGDRAALDEYIADAARIDLAYNDRVIAFEYAAPRAFFQEQTQFAYKLEGLDTAWVQGGSEQEAKYTSLPSGTYTFLVKASDMNGIWQAEPTKLTVAVHPPWWRTWWFIAASIGAIVGGVFFAYKRRIQAIAQRTLELERLVEERTQQLKESNVEVHRQLEILNDQAKEIEISNTRLQESNFQLDTTLNELKETQAQLVQSERINAAGMLTAGVMHEINNPNASIHSALELAHQQLRGLEKHFLSLLDDEGRASHEATQFVSMIGQIKEILTVSLTGSDRIRAIVTSLQGFTKHQQEGKTKNSIAEELHSTATMFRYQFKDVEVKENISSEIRINAQWSEINQAMLNLLVNAAQAGATQISMSAEQNAEDGTLEIRVQDNGSGMTEETKKRLFEPFYTTKSIGNSGLGLSITRQIIERHHGTITVESTKGQGTTFIVTLPKNSNGAA